MPKMPFELANVFQHDVNEILEARKKCLLLHHTHDIDTAGAEVDETVRQVLRRRLSRTYHVGHGHIVDSKLAFSPQLDVIISDELHTPVLFTAKDNTEYTPFESVFAIGEVKASYAKSKKYIETFSGTLKAIKNNLHREPVPPDVIRGIRIPSPLTTNIAVPYRNPLMTFMVFAEGGDFRLEDVAEHYKTTPVDELPAIVCILDRGCIISGSMEGQQFRGVDATPIFRKADSADIQHRWMLMKVGNAEAIPACSFAMLTITLFAAFEKMELFPPNMERYINAVIAGNKLEAQIITPDEPSRGMPGSVTV